MKCFKPSLQDDEILEDCSLLSIFPIKSLKIGLFQTEIGYKGREYTYSTQLPKQSVKESSKFILKELRNIIIQTDQYSSTTGEEVNHDWMAIMSPNDIESDPSDKDFINENDSDNTFMDDWWFRIIANGSIFQKNKALPFYRFRNIKQIVSKFLEKEKLESECNFQFIFRNRNIKEAEIYSSADQQNFSELSIISNCLKNIHKYSKFNKLSYDIQRPQLRKLQIHSYFSDGTNPFAWAFHNPGMSKEKEKQANLLQGFLQEVKKIQTLNYLDLDFDEYELGESQAEMQRAIQELPNLQTLILSYCQFQNEYILPNQNQKQLKTLFLEDECDDLNYGEKISQLTQIEHLRTTYSQFENNLVQLEKMQNLKSLYLNYCDNTKLPSFNKLQNLQSLTMEFLLNGQNCSFKELEILSKIKNLIQLNLHFSCDQLELKELIEILFACKALQKFTLIIQANFPITNSPFLIQSMYQWLNQNLALQDVIIRLNNWYPLTEDEKQFIKQKDVEKLKELVFSLENIILFDMYISRNTASFDSQFQSIQKGC